MTINDKKSSILPGEQSDRALRSGASSADLTSPPKDLGRQRRRWSGYLTSLLPALLGSALYLLNNLDVIHGLIAPPPGYAALGVQRNPDIAQYLTWLNGLKKAWILPNYHAPWVTPPGLIVPGLFPVSIVERSLSISPILALQLFGLIGYISTAYAVAFAYRTFCRTRRQAFWSLLIAFSCVPVASLPGLSYLLRNHSQYGEALGRVQFMTVSDGVLRGLVTWPFEVYGTCAQVLSMAFLARYCASRELRWLWSLALVCLLSALIHPFEIFVTVTVVAFVLMQQPWHIRNVLVGMCAVLTAAVVGVSPYVIQSLRIPWVGEIAEANRHLVDIAPAPLFAMMGFPAILVVILFLLGFPRKRDHNSIVLVTWFAVTLLVFYFPRMPFAIHFLDGLFFAVGLLLTLQLAEVVARLPDRWASSLRIVAIPVLILTLYPHVAYRLQAWKAGVDLQSTKFRYPMAIAPVDEFAIVKWLNKNASPDDLVLATEDAAPWVATAPIHSFASHWVLSLLVTRPTDSALRDAFFNGSLTPAKARELLDTLGVRYVVVPDRSLATLYLIDATLRARFDNSGIYELPGQRMKPYGESKIAALGTSH